MKKRRATIRAIIGVFIAGAFASGCSMYGKQTAPVNVAAADFDKIHAATDDDANKFLILGNVKAEQPSKDLPDDLRPFLGRWEGYNTNLPAKKDLKIALAIRSIGNKSAEGVIYYGYNFQYPTGVKKIFFKVSTGTGTFLEAPLESEKDSETGSYIKLSFQKETGNLTGEIALGSGTANFVGSQSVNTVELSRNSSFYVYKDYRAYLTGLRIYPEKYGNAELNRYGNGYLIYLPEGYEKKPDRKWPLLLFMHGMGDRGDNVYILAKASPFKMIREKGPLPFVIVAPLLSGSPDFFSFPGKYLEGVLDEVSKKYRIDEKRVYLTGLSLGGEAAFRFALEHPEKIAAIASLSGVLALHVPEFYKTEVQELNGIPLSRLREVPAWQLHSANDTIVPLFLGQKLVDDFARAGVNVRFTVIPDHDHDIWSDTYSDPEFYKWFLQYRKK